MRLSTYKLKMAFKSSHIGVNNLSTYPKRSQKSHFAESYSVVKQLMLAGNRIYVNYRK